MASLNWACGLQEMFEQYYFFRERLKYHEQYSVIPRISILLQVMKSHHDNSL